MQELFVPNLVIESLCDIAAERDHETTSLAHVVQAGEPLLLSDSLRGFFNARPASPAPQSLRPDRNARRFILSFRSQTPANGPRSRRSGVRSGTRRSMCWTASLSPVPAGVIGELYVAGARSGARLPGPAGADGGAVRRRPVRRVAAGCTARATGRAGGRTARWSSSAGRTTRSSCAGSASSRARSRPRWRHTGRVAGCGGRARRTGARSVWSATWWGDRDHARPSACAPMSAGTCRTTWCRRRSWCWTACR